MGDDMTFGDTALVIIIVLLIVLLIWSRVMQQTMLDTFKEITGMIKEIKE